MMPNGHFALNIKKLAFPIFPLLTLCFLTSKFSKLFHIVFPHLKPFKASSFLFASSLGVKTLRELRVFFLSSFHNASFIFLASRLFVCLLHLFTLQVFFTCLLHQPHVLFLPTLCAQLLTSIAYLLLAFVACLSFWYLTCLPCVPTLACFAHLVFLFCLPTLSFASHVALPLTPA